MIEKLDWIVILEKEDMKHAHSDKYTIAWFKIAEYVSRGEKERALGIYRLLSHSFNDDSVARQLEADIYLACNEKDSAIALYRQAVELYQKTERFLEAAAVCEHLIVLLPHDLLLRTTLLGCYIGLGLVPKALEHFQVIISSYLQSAQWHCIDQEIVACGKITNVAMTTALYQHIIVAVSKNNNCIGMAMVCIEKVIDNLVYNGGEGDLQKFLTSLSGINNAFYEYALLCLKKS